MTSSHPEQSGEAGHQGADRQAGKHPGTSNQPTPDGVHAVSPEEARKRSTEAMNKPADLEPDHLHPGPTRHDSEKSKGNAHHDQHEPQPEMMKEFEEL